jgi:hypothetical protein
MAGRPNPMPSHPQPGLGPGHPQFHPGHIMVNGVKRAAPTPIQIEAEFAQVPQPAIYQLRSELGIERDVHAMDHQEKWRIVCHAKFRYATQGQGQGQAGQGPVLGPGQGKMGNGVAGPSAPQSGMMPPRGGKRGSTSPPEDVRFNPSYVRKVKL